MTAARDAAAAGSSPAMAAALPRDALGVGLRPPHLREAIDGRPDVGYFEVISENFLGPAALPRRNLLRVRERYPVVLHGVGLNLLGHEPLDGAYLDALAALADAIDAPFVTDHLCWSGAHGRRYHDLLPAPYTEDLVAYAAARAAAVQTRLGRPFGLENLSSYAAFRASTMTEWEFYAEVVRRAGCWFMLDVNNVYVSSRNHGFDPLTYLRAIDYARVLQVHLAGHQTLDDGTLLDTHDRPVRDEVWALYAEAWRLGGPFPTLLERDDAMPPLPELLAELRRAETARRRPAEGGDRPGAGA